MKISFSHQKSRKNINIWRECVVSCFDIPSQLLSTISSYKKIKKNEWNSSSSHHGAIVKGVKLSNLWWSWELRIKSNDKWFGDTAKGKKKSEEIFSSVSDDDPGKSFHEIQMCRKTRHHYSTWLCLFSHFPPLIKMLRWLLHNLDAVIFITREMTRDLVVCDVIMSGELKFHLHAKYENDWFACR